MLEDIRHAAARQRKARAVRRMTLDCKRLLSEKGELGGQAVAIDLIDRLETLDDEDLDGFFDYLANDLSPDPQAVLQAAQAYAAAPGAATLAMPLLSSKARTRRPSSCCAALAVSKPKAAVSAITSRSCARPSVGSVAW
jgi:hypothetical protein